MGLHNQGANSTPAATREVKSNGHLVIPYMQGLYESIKKICGRYGIQTHIQRWQHHQEPPGTPLRTKTLWSPKVMPSYMVSMWGPHL